MMKTQTVYAFARRSNRRLACTGARPPGDITDELGHATTQDLATVIRLPAQVCVIDVKSKRDVTEATLLSVVADLERRNTPAMLSREFLRELIRFQAQGPQPLLRAFLEDSLRYLIEESKDE